MWGAFGRLVRDDRGAVAPTVALSLFALIGAGGIAFDYARLAAMDTELQQAADQAALAAATQLDRAEGAQTRATNTIENSDSDNRLAANITRFSNDDAGQAVEVGSITFCSAFDDTVADNATACTETNDDLVTRFVIVTTELRTANYALTPIVAAFSGSIAATAVAGVESSICNVSPLLVCAPDKDWPDTSDIGEGIRLKPGPNTGAWAPGDFGLLDFGSGAGDVADALRGFGLNGCQATETTLTQPGSEAQKVADAINTRLDVYDKGDASVCDTSTGAGCPAASARKDAIIDITPKNGPTIQKVNDATPPTQAQIDTAAAGLSCPADPKGAKLVFTPPTSPVQGLNRDSCHYTNSCGGTDSNIGDKNWDRNAYFLRNYGWDSATWPTNTGLPTSATRYQVYQWELQREAANPGTGLATKKFATVDSSPKESGPATNKTYTWTVHAACSYPAPKYGSTAYPEQKDRRILTIIAADCTDLKGKGSAFEDFTILRAFDVLLTEPSISRTYPATTSFQEIYGEIIGPADPGESGGGFQYYTRAKPYLVR
jgi:Flp pilus assembly protein TadG